ncbi:hypothetical protein [Thalassomonas sp. RHCl1]|nr:hypothetical protein [Thalassomonas sp. RHCl1]
MNSLWIFIRLDSGEFMEKCTGLAAVNRYFLLLITWLKRYGIKLDIAKGN